MLPRLSVENLQESAASGSAVASQQPSVTRRYVDEQNS